jgi:hypothetical protein
MILAHRPRRIIEIGSGFSSACMLDALDAGGIEECRLHCIDPHPERLLGTLRGADRQRVTIDQQPVQAVSRELFRTLQANDILFIDSTHVLKTGSDVACELFEILPVLEKNVLVHFHDIQYPFEYPEEWAVRRNFSWNEVYALRAFLMYNRDFEILFFNSFFTARQRPKIAASAPGFLRNPGGSLWLRKTGEAWRRPDGRQA